MIRLVLAATAALAGTAAIAAQPAPTADPSRQALADGAEVVCKYVVAAGRARDSKPYRLCQSEQAWTAKSAADDADANHVECHYQEISGSRLRVGKRCMTADMWVQERQMTADFIQKIQAGTGGPH